MKQNLDISIIIPTYNEENSIADVVDQIKDIFEHELKKNKYEIIVVNDGSTDQSGSIIENIKNIKSITHSNNLGYGASIKTGIKHSAGDVVLIIDADSTYPANAIPKLLEHIETNDMVVGARSLKNSNIPLIRKPVKYILGKLANYLADYNIPDLNSGLRAINKEPLLKYFKILPSGFSFTTTITLAMHCNGHNVEYIPIDYKKRKGESKFSPVKDTLNFILLIFRTIIYFDPLKVFLPLCGIFFMFFLIFLGYDIFTGFNLTDKTLFMFIAFIQIMAIGLLADLINKRN